MKISLNLTEAQANKLVEALEDHRDEGPMHAGWKSDALESVSWLVSEAVEAATKTTPPLLKNEILDLLQYKPYKPGDTVSIRTTLPPMSWKGINQPKRGKNQSFRSVQFGAVY